MRVTRQIYRDWENYSKKRHAFHLTIKKKENQNHEDWQSYNADRQHFASCCEGHLKDGELCNLSIHKSYYQKIYHRNKIIYYLVDIVFCDVHNNKIDLLRNKDGIILDDSEEIPPPPFIVIVPINASKLKGNRECISSHIHVTKDLLVTVLEELSVNCGINQARKSIVNRYAETMHEALSQECNRNKHISMNQMGDEVDKIFP